MERIFYNRYLFLIVFLSFTITSLTACDSQTASPETKSTATETTEKERPVDDDTAINENGPEIENKSYLFDVTNHTVLMNSNHYW